MVNVSAAPVLLPGDCMPSGCAGHSDVKAVVDQEIGQEIARLEAKIDAVISKYHDLFNF